MKTYRCIRILISKTVLNLFNLIIQTIQIFKQDQTKGRENVWVDWVARCNKVSMFLCVYRQSLSCSRVRSTWWMISTLWWRHTEMPWDPYRSSPIKNSTSSSALWKNSAWSMKVSTDPQNLLVTELMSRVFEKNA